MRKATVEIDKITGTSWPPASVDKDGKTHTLKGIYADAGMDLDVVLDQPDLPVPASGPNFDLPSLHAYMTQHRRSQVSGWHAHILVVPNIEYAEGWQISRPLGVMYDFRSSDLNNMPREGCAMSANAVQVDNRMYLRTLAHELGHVFNLLHPKHENPPLPIGTTLMNQTADLQQLGSFPGNIEYRFSDANQSWLKDAPAEFVMPGGRPFADRPQDASVLVTDEAIPNTPGLTLEISTKSPTFELGEPVYLRVTLRNDGNAPIEINSLLSLSAGTVDVWIRAPNNREFRFRPVVMLCSEAHVVVLPPGQEILASEPIFFGARGQSFAVPGEYKLRARFQASFNGQQQVAVAKQHAIEVRPPQSAVSSDIADAVASPSAALYLILRGGAHLRGAEETLTRIVNEAPAHPAAQHARLAMAAQSLSPETIDLERAVRLLGDVHTEQLNLTQRADQQRLVGVTSARRGNDSAMSDALQKFADLARKSRPNAAQLVSETTHWVERRLRSGS